MSNLKDWKQLHGIESLGGFGSFGLRIEVAGTHLPKDLSSSALYSAIYEAAEKLEGAIRTAAIAEDPVAQAAAQNERAGLLSCFGNEKIFVKEIPNGYCSRWCCKHLPWFLVTTEVGVIKIGWRKSVINIDWSELDKRGLTAEFLFPDENVTKGDKYIHAWSIEKAKQYVQQVIGTSLRT